MYISQMLARVGHILKSGSVIPSAAIYDGDVTLKSRSAETKVRQTNWYPPFPP